jgi:hypothetical protein
MVWGVRPLRLVRVPLVNIITSGHSPRVSFFALGWHWVSSHRQLRPQAEYYFPRNLRDHHADVSLIVVLLDLYTLFSPYS